MPCGQAADGGNLYTGPLSGNALKVIACISMLIDHVGMIFFPDVVVLRVIGRLAMPLFAFTFAEGCFYSRHRLRRFLLILCLGIATSSVMSFVEKSPQGDILITLSLSALVIGALDALKRSAFAHQVKKTVVSALLLAAAVAFCVGVCCFSGLNVDYGLAGVLLPVTVRLLDFRPYGAKGALSAIYTPVTMLLLFAAGLLFVVLFTGEIQLFSLVSLIFIALYSGKRGKAHLKALFYVFYPAHLAVLGAVYLIVWPEFFMTLF